MANVYNYVTLNMHGHCMHTCYLDVLTSASVAFCAWGRSMEAKLTVSQTLLHFSNE